MMKRKYNLAIIIDQKIEEGGGYQQSLNAAFLAKNLKNDIYQIKFYSIIKSNINQLKKYNINAEYLRITKFIKFISLIKINPKYKIIKYFLNLFLNLNPLEKILKIRKIDLVYFLSPSRYSSCVGTTNFIFTIWDICHRDNPEFPEVRRDNEFEIREYLYSKVIPKATGIIVDSIFSKKNISKIYNIPEDKFVVLPFEPSPLINSFQKANRIKNNFNDKNILSQPYIFYPAQFWAHKNHFYILEGLSILKNVYSIDINVIFTGSDKGNLKYIKKSAAEFGVTDKVKFMGFVDSKYLIEIYLNSFAIVMPTYFGPTNLPPLEAFKLEIPLIYPNLKGMNEQIGDAALLIDLDDPETLAKHLKNLYLNQELREKLINAGRIRYQYIKTIDKSKDLSELIKKFFSKRKCWD